MNGKNVQDFLLKRKHISSAPEFLVSFNRISDLMFVILLIHPLKVFHTDKSPT